MVRVQDALQDPVAVRTDETLITILLLRMLEVATATAKSLPRTAAHTGAATALIKLREQDTVQSETFTRLLASVRLPVVFINRSNLMPFLVWKVSTKTGAKVPVFGGRKDENGLAAVASDLPNLRTLADKLFKEPERSETIQAVLQLMEQCHEIDNALSAWSDNIPDRLRYLTITPANTIVDDLADIPPQSVPGQIEIYRDIWITRTWNSYRTTRLFVQALVIRCVAWLNNTSVWSLDDETGMADTVYVATAIKARSILQAMVDGVCASLPAHVGYLQRDGTYKKLRLNPSRLESNGRVEAAAPAFEVLNEGTEPVYELGGSF